jgi:hypothetical protein
MIHCPVLLVIEALTALETYSHGSSGEAPLPRSASIAHPEGHRQRQDLITVAALYLLIKSAGSSG